MKSTALVTQLRMAGRLLAGFQWSTHREVTEVLDDVRRLSPRGAAREISKAGFRTCVCSVFISRCRNSFSDACRYGNRLDQRLLAGLLRCGDPCGGRNA